jgi:hypothetical protein
LFEKDVELGSIASINHNKASIAVDLLKAIETNKPNSHVVFWLADRTQAHLTAVGEILKFLMGMKDFSQGKVEFPYVELSQMPKHF